MSRARAVQLGSVVWADLEDANGFRKVRPAVVLTATADIAAGKPVHVVAITTRLPEPLSDDHVLLPWDRQGKARSGLRRRCAAVTSWRAEVAVGDLQVVGILPPAIIVTLLAKIAAPPPHAPHASQSGLGVTPTTDATVDSPARADDDRDADSIAPPQR